ncbi:unnamed protein product [Amoebophrya sp. A25]|nr:unnamed protein product [Amoebophrya sp. A25]|eukprot:GSA25T00016002001.1
MGNNQQAMLGGEGSVFRHTMDRDQLNAFVATINESSEAIRNIHVHATYIQGHARAATQAAGGMETKSQVLLAGLLRMRDLVQEKSDNFILQAGKIGQEAGRRFARVTQRLETLEIQPFLDEVKGNIILVVVPLIVLILEVFVFGAYLSIVVATLPQVSLHVRSYLIVGAAMAIVCYLGALLWFSSDRLLNLTRERRKTRRRKEQKFERLVKEMRTQHQLQSPLELQVLLADPQARRALEKAGSLQQGLASLRHHSSATKAGGGTVVSQRFSKASERGPRAVSFAFEAESNGEPGRSQTKQERNRNVKWCSICATFFSIPV